MMKKKRTATGDVELRIVVPADMAHVFALLTPRMAELDFPDFPLAHLPPKKRAEVVLRGALAVGAQHFLANIYEATHGREALWDMLEIVDEVRDRLRGGPLH